MLTKTLSINNSLISEEKMTFKLPRPKTDMVSKLAYTSQLFGGMPLKTKRAQFKIMILLKKSLKCILRPHVSY